MTVIIPFKLIINLCTEFHIFGLEGDETLGAVFHSQKDGRR
jgi:hypothetical protein